MVFIRCVVPTFTRGPGHDFILYKGGGALVSGVGSGVPGAALDSLGPHAGQGNRGRYSNPEFDKALIEARATLDDGKRQTLLQTAMDIGMKDEGVIPIFFLANSWALKKGLTYQGRSDGYTLPYYVRQAN